MKHTLQNLLAAGKTDEVLDQLRQLAVADEALAQSVVHTAARFAQLKRQSLEGAISFADANVERNQINKALLHLIAQLPDTQPPATDAPAAQPEKTVIQNADKIYNIGHIDHANFS